jgi:methionyl-tRNA formyltransferase
VLRANILSAPDDHQNVTFQTVPGLVLDDQLAIGCGTGAIRPITVQRAGRSAMDVWELLRGFPIPAGSRLG